VFDRRFPADSDTPTTRRRKLGEILRDAGSVTDAQLNAGLQRQRADRCRIRLGEALVALDYATDKDIARALAAQHHLPYRDLSLADRKAIIRNIRQKAMPDRVMRRRAALPLESTRGRLRIVIHDPTDERVIHDVTRDTQRDVEVFVTARDAIDELVDYALPAPDTEEDLEPIDINFDAQGDRDFDIEAPVLANDDSELERLFRMESVDEYVDLDKADHTEIMVKIGAGVLPVELIKQFNVAPYGKKDGRIVVLTGEPDNVEVMDTLRFRLDAEVLFVAADPEKLRSLIELATDAKSIEHEMMCISTDDIDGPDAEDDDAPASPVDGSGLLDLCHEPSATPLNAEGYLDDDTDSDGGVTLSPPGRGDDGDELTLDTVGSGAGLLDLTHEPDEQSLGAVALLDDIAPADATGSATATARATASGGAIAPSSASGLFEAVGGLESAPSDLHPDATDKPAPARRAGGATAKAKHAYSGKTAGFMDSLKERAKESLVQRRRSIAEPTMALSPGGRMKQVVIADPFNVTDWDAATYSRCFVHLANSRTWQRITGGEPPTEPPTAAEYAEANLPWFRHYTDGQPLPGSSILAALKSVFTLGMARGEDPLPENTSVRPKQIIGLREGLEKDQVRECDF